MKIIDLRSDTVTKPSPEMWDYIKSMGNVQLGDDVMGEDPTVNELENKAAKVRKEYESSKQQSPYSA